MKISELSKFIVATWVGLVFGLSFIEAPLKFTAPGITTILGLGIGRIVFDISNKVQLIFLLLPVFSIAFKKIKLSKNGTIALAILVSIMILQNLWLLPVLDERAADRIAQVVIEDSLHHLIFVLFEILKLVSLSILYFNINQYE